MVILVIITCTTIFLILHKVSNDISNIDHFVSIQISYEKFDQYAALLCIHSVNTLNICMKKFDAMKNLMSAF